MLNPEIEELRTALWNLFYDRREDKIGDEGTLTLGSILHTLVELRVHEHEVRQEAKERREAQQKES